MKYLLVLKQQEYVEYPIADDTSFPVNKLFLASEDIIGTIQTITKQFNIDETERYLVIDDQDSHSYFHDAIMTIGERNADIVVDKVKLLITRRNIECIKAKENCYLNGKKLERGIKPFKSGDILQLGATRIVIKPGIVTVYGNGYKTALVAKQNVNPLFEDFPNYSKSPRIIKTIDESAIEILNPPQKESMNAKGLFMTFLPTLLMVGVSVGVRFFIGSGMMMMLMVATSFVTLITNVIKYFSDKKSVKEKNIKRKEVYEEYLLKVRKQIDNRKKETIETLDYNYPSLKNIEEMINDYNLRIYERSNNDDDFLSVCIGHKKAVTPFAVRFKSEEMEMNIDELKEKGEQLAQENQTIDHMPIDIDLKQSHLGLVGNASNVHKQLNKYLLQLSFFHSYHDVEFIFIYNDKYQKEFDYTYWYPHMHLNAINVSTNVHNERMRDQVIGSVYQILNDRKLKADEKNITFAPHLVFIIDDVKLISNHSILEYLQDAVNNLAYSIIYTTDKQAKLPENIRSVIKIDNEEKATLVLNNGRYINSTFDLENDQNVDYEKCARRLASFVHEEKATSNIPDSIDFLSLYKAETVNDLNIEERWNTNKPYKSLAVPLGLRSEDDIVSLDLHERAHGPHGLVAGTTGSGKSEIIQSYILSLAVNFSPSDVGFLLIDYKGGGMANLFENLPHLLGTITNLDGSEAMRALVSIKSELQRRQKLFEENDVNNINSYHKLMNDKPDMEPLPHLFIISDEFAELKKEQPEFMKELVSTARVGRSLGVHLILATQKPAGVVDEQIWSNSKFKLCLMVQSEADSREVLKTSDAASITRPGRSYLQVGNNEIYELFQSAYSGASYEREEEDDQVDNRVYLVNELGQNQLINDDLSGNEQSNDREKETQLDVIINYIHQEYLKKEHKPIKKPWLPSLPFALVNKHNVVNIKDELSLAMPLGVIDIPERQTQTEYVIDLVKDGNLAYIASSGYGKSMLLSNAMLSLASKNSVENLNLYIFDYGNGALVQYARLPHCSGYINIDDDERFNKFLNIIQEEMRERKGLLANANAQNFAVYNRIAKQKLKAIVIVIDNIDVMKEKSVEEQNIFSKIARDGTSIGIYMVFTATRFGEIRTSTINQIKNKIAGFLFDKSETSQIVGMSEYTLTDVKGRALVKDDKVHLMQNYLPIESKDDVDYIQKTTDYINNIIEAVGNEKAEQIAVLPETLSLRDLNTQTYHAYDNYDFYLGLDCEEVNLKGGKLGNEPFLILGPKQCGKTNALSLIISQLKGTKLIFDTSRMNLNKFMNDDKVVYGFNTNNYGQGISVLVDAVEKRTIKLNEAVEKDSMLNTAEFTKTFDELSVFIDDVDYFDSMISDKDKMIEIIKKALELNVHFFVAGDTDKMPLRNAICKELKFTNTGLVLAKTKTNNFFEIGMNAFPSKGNGIVVDISGNTMIKMAKYE